MPDVDFTIPDGDAAGEKLTVFTTRPDTLWGATFMVIAPEHPLVRAITTDDRRNAVERYVAAAATRTELERTAEDKEKSGVFTGGFAVNPVNGEQVPVWVADYVLISYGTGAIMAVPAHDQRDFEFARSFGLTIVPVIQPEGQDPLDEPTMTGSYVGPGVMVNSGPLDGVPVTEQKGRANPSIAAALDWLEANGAGTESINFRIRDWLISRQRYWGSPIPMIHTADGAVEAVPDADLPVILPEDVEFHGRSPLVETPEFLAATDSTGAPARRETDTMDTFMCSSWYWFRYLSPHLDEGPFDPEEAAYWLPVDTYTGGAEHAVMHLLYARFFVKAMRDMGVFSETEAAMIAHGRQPDQLFDEPFTMLRNQGQILGEERIGDRLVITADKVDGRYVAASVRVDPDADDAAGDVVGELMRRTENTLQVQHGDAIVTVEVPGSATIQVPGVPGPNEVNQLKHHLEIQRMSKSKGNVVNPDELVVEFGADTVRTYLMFAFEWQKGGPWNSQGIMGSRRFIEDVWKIGTVDYAPSSETDDASIALRRRTHQTIDRVDNGMTTFKWNTSVAALMALRNDMTDAARRGSVSAAAWNEGVDTMLKLLAPIAPHITEELWRLRGNDVSIHLQAWPLFDAAIAAEDMITMVVQVNGKVRDRIEVPADVTSEEAESLALASERIREWTEGATIRKVISRPPKLISIVAN